MIPLGQDRKAVSDGTGNRPCLPPTLPSPIFKDTPGHACMLSSLDTQPRGHKQLSLDSGLREEALETWLAWEKLLGSVPERPWDQITVTWGGKPSILTTWNRPSGC